MLLCIACMQAYQALVEKHSQLAREHRLLLEQVGEASVSSQVEELLAVRQQLAELLPRYNAACDQVAELRCALMGAGNRPVCIAFYLWNTCCILLHCSSAACCASHDGPTVT